MQVVALVEILITLSQAVKLLRAIWALSGDCLSCR